MPTAKRPVRAGAALWLLAYALLAFAFAGSRPLWEPDEGRYAESAREMAVGGDWLVPHLEGVSHLTKPPFAYWMTAAGLKVFGINEWGARLPLSCFFFATILCVAALGRAWGWSDVEARLAGLIFGSAALPFFCGHIVTTDMFLTFWETFGVLCAWRVWTARDAGEASRWRLFFYAAFGFAFLTKGPPGLMPLLAVVGLRALGRPRPPLTEKHLWSWSGVLLTILISTSWFIVLRVFRGISIIAFIHDEVYDRIFTDVHGRDNTFLMYFYLIPLGLMPWIFLWPGIVTRAWRKICMVYVGATRGSPSPLVGLEGRPTGRPYDTDGPVAKMRAGIGALDDRELFSILWFAIPLIIFCFAKSRMPLYVVPLMAPIALWAARVATSEAWLLRFWSRSRVWVWRAVLSWTALLFFATHPPARYEEGRDYRDFALKLAPLLHSSSDRLYCIDAPPPYSITFYSAMPVEYLDTNFRDIILPLQVAADRGRMALLLVKHKDLGSFADYPATRYKLLEKMDAFNLCQILTNRDAPADPN